MRGFERGYCRTLGDIFALSAHGRENLSLAHLAIDVQEEYLFCDKDHEVAERIGRHIAPAFTRLGVSNYWVYFKPPQSSGLSPLSRWPSQKKKSEQIFSEHVRPSACDRIIPKKETSVVSGSDIHMELQAVGREIIVVSGFTTGICVLDSVLDLRRLGYKVAVLEDGIDMKPEHSFSKEQMQASGAVVTTSDKVFSALENLRR